MQIKISEYIVTEVKVTQTMTCPAGTAYWTVDYCIDGLCIHSAATGAIYGNPDVIAMLDREYEVHGETHYIDDAHPMPDPLPRGARYGTSGDNQAWFSPSRHVTHRQAIIDAVAQIVQN